MQGAALSSPVLAGLSGLCALAYLFMHSDGWVQSIVKTAAIGALAIWAAWLGLGWLAVALAFSALGDFALSRPGERAFLIGMAAFGVAHLLFAALFVGLILTHGASQGALRVAAVIAVLTLAALLGRAYIRRAGALALPVAVYVVFIAAMAVAALLAPASPGATLAMVGALAFVASDAILGQQKFLAQSWPGQDAAIWVFYYAAQVLLFVGLAAAP